MHLVRFVFTLFLGGGKGNSWKIQNITFLLNDNYFYIWARSLHMKHIYNIIHQKIKLKAGNKNAMSVCWSVCLLVHLSSFCFWGFWPFLCKLMITLSWNLIDTLSLPPLYWLTYSDAPINPCCFLSCECTQDIFWCIVMNSTNIMGIIFSCDQAALRTPLAVCISVRLSVCLSVTPFSLCSCHRIIMTEVMSMQKVKVISQRLRSQKS